MYIMANEFHIKPWEYNSDGEVYQEDLVDLRAIKQIQWKSEKDEMERTRSQSDANHRVMRVR
jgi:hypothetical protein